MIRQQELTLDRRGRFFEFNSRRGVYEDHVDNYVTSEPAIDYTVASIFLLATLGR